MPAYATLSNAPCIKGDCYETRSSPPGKQPVREDSLPEHIDFRTVMECGDDVNGFQLQFDGRPGSPALTELRKRLAGLIDQIDGATGTTATTRFTLELGGLLLRS